MIAHLANTTYFIIYTSYIYLIKEMLIYLYMYLQENL